MQVEYIPDCDVGNALDAELRTLLSSCFTGEASAVFSRQRFFHEMPRHRWLARDSSGQLVAHLAIHDKILGTTAGDLHVGGIAEVCVAASHRGQGLVRRLVAVSDAWLVDHGIPFGILLGELRVYGSSGYCGVENPIRYLDPKTGAWRVEPMTNFLVKPLSSVPWPVGEIDLRGPTF